MNLLIIFGFISYISCTKNYMCDIQVTPRHDVRRCNRYSCDGYWIEKFENATCKNLDQMHASQHICASKCTIIFTEKIGIIRTNSFSLLTNLDQVFLNNTEIDTIQSKSFSGLPKVELINLGKNRINEILKNTFFELPNLKILNLSDNRIDFIEAESFSGCKTLKTLDLSSNKLKNLSTVIIESLFQLNILNLSRNYLEVIDPYLCLHLHSLKFLILDHNRISSLVNCTSNYNIKILSLSYNNLEDLNGHSFPTNLKTLNLSGNHIATIKNGPLQNLAELEILDLSKNIIETLPFELFRNLRNLSHLDISSNNIATLNEGVFHGLANLNFLNLSGINSPTIEASVFYSTRNISVIDISGNNLNFLDTKALVRHCPKLKYLKIDGNCFTCRDLAETLLFAQENKILIPLGQSLGGNHLDGIACVDVQEQSPNSNSSNPAIDFFEGGFKKSSFFKFFSTFRELKNSQNDIREFVEIQKYLVKNISEAIEITGDRISKNLLKGQENLRKIDGTNELLQKLLKIIQLRNGSQKSINFTSELFSVLDLHNQAAFTAENSNMKNIVDSLSDLKLIFIASIFILVSFGVVKLFRQFRTYFPINSLNIDSQELPFMERQTIQTL